MVHRFRDLLLICFWLAVPPDAWCQEPARGDLAEFKRLDQNEDGYLSGREALGLSSADTNRDGRISRAEWEMSVPLDRLRTGTTAEAEAWFSARDINEDGRLTGTESRGLQSLDLDQDGRIPRSEFLAALKLPQAADRPGEKPGTPDSSEKPVRKLTEWDRTLARQFDGGKRRALLIGVNRYPVSPLSFCVADARLLADVLTRVAGYEPADVVLMTDDLTNRELQPNKAAIQAQLDRILPLCQPNDTLLIFFSGHGIQVNDRSYFCPLDFNATQPSGTALSFDLIRQQLSQCRAAQKLLVLDSCHSGGAVNTPFTPANAETGEQFSRARGLITLASCRSRESSLESGRNGHGIFSLSLARGLTGAADYDGNQLVDSDEVYRHVLTEVPVEAGVWQPGHSQTPVRIIGQDVVGVFCLSRPRQTGAEGDIAGAPRKPGDIVVNSIGMRLVYLPHSVFVMGSASDEVLRNEDELLRPVVVTRPTLIGVCEVTQGEFEIVTGENPSYFSEQGDGRDAVRGFNTSRMPVEQVSWAAAQEFCNRLSARPAERSAKRRYRLPTEAEWEFACRAGTTTAFAYGDELDDRQANIRGDRPYGSSRRGEFLGRTSTVGAFPPNAYGIHDMHGNVSEWCLDPYEAYVSPGLPGQKDHRTPLDVAEALQEIVREPRHFASLLRDPSPRQVRGNEYVHRGGSFSGDVSFCRSAARRRANPEFRHRTLGFRVIVEVGGAD